jgi:Flp pilus assembly protein TadG
MQMRPAGRRGVTTVEAALVFLAFLTLVLGMLDLGLAVFRNHLVCEAARQGARQAIVHGSLAPSATGVWGPDPVGPVQANDPNALAQAVQPFVADFDPGAVTVQARWLDGGNAPGQRVQVTVNATYPLLLPSLVGVSSLSLHATSTMPVAH